MYKKLEISAQEQAKGEVDIENRNRLSHISKAHEAQIRSLRAHLDERTQLLLDNRSELASYKHERDALRMQLENAFQKLEEQKARAEQAEVQASSFKGSFAASDGRLQEINSQYLLALKSVESLSQAKEEGSKALQDLRSQLQRLEQFEAKYSELREKFSLLSEEFGEYKINAETNQQKLKSNYDALLQNAGTQRNRAEQAEAQHAKAEELYRNTACALQEVNTQYLVALKFVEALSLAKEENNSALEDLRAQLRRLEPFEIQYNDLQVRFSNLTQEFSSFKSENENYTSKLRSDYELAAQNADAQRIRAEQAEEKSAANEDLYRNANSSFQELNTQYLLALKSVEEISNANSILNDANLDLRTQLNRLAPFEESFISAQESNNSLKLQSEKARADYEIAITEADLKIKRLEEQILMQTARAEQAETKAASFEQSFKSSNSRLEEINTQYLLSLKSVENLSQSQESLSGLVADLKGQLARSLPYEGKYFDTLKLQQEANSDLAQKDSELSLAIQKIQSLEDRINELELLSKQTNKERLSISDKYDKFKEKANLQISELKALFTDAKLQIKNQTERAEKAELEIERLTKNAKWFKEVSNRLTGKKSALEKVAFAAKPIDGNIEANSSNPKSNAQ